MGMQATLKGLNFLQEALGQLRACKTFRLIKALCSKLILYSRGLIKAWKQVLFKVPLKAQRLVCVLLQYTCSHMRL